MRLAQTVIEFLQALFNAYIEQSLKQAFAALGEMGPMVPLAVCAALLTVGVANRSTMRLWLVGVCVLATTLSDALLIRMSESALVLGHCVMGVALGASFRRFKEPFLGTFLVLSLSLAIGQALVLIIGDVEADGRAVVWRLFCATVVLSTLSALFASEISSRAQKNWQSGRKVQAILQGSCAVVLATFMVLLLGPKSGEIEPSDGHSIEAMRDSLSMMRTEFADQSSEQIGEVINQFGRAAEVIASSLDDRRAADKPGIVELRKALVRRQWAAFPAMRERVGAILNEGSMSSFGHARVFGERATFIEFVSLGRRPRLNMEAEHEAHAMALTRMRFRRADYKWTEDDMDSSYPLESPGDSDVVIYNALGGAALVPGHVAH